jgi:hypothetical protein
VRCVLSAGDGLPAAGPTQLRRAIERGNLPVADITSREIGRINLVEALELTALIAKRDPKRHRRYAVRWLWRYLGESESVMIDDAAVAVGLLLALGGKRHDEALLALLGRPNKRVATARKLPYGDAMHGGAA